MTELTPIEILEKLDAFYSNAWNKLILFTTILLAVVGIVIPMIINWWQSRNLRLKEENLKTELNDQLEKKLKEFKDDLEESVNSKFEEKVDEIKKYQDKIKGKLQGMLFHGQANSETDSKEKLIYLIWSASQYIIGDDLLNLDAVLDMIIRIIPKVDKNEINEIKTQDANLDKLIEKLLEINEKDVLTQKIRDIRLEVSRLDKKNAT